MDDFQKELQGLDVSSFQASQMTPVNAQGQYNMDQARQCGMGVRCFNCFHNCFNCFRCFNCFNCRCSNCFHCGGGQGGGSCFGGGGQGGGS